MAELVICEGGSDLQLEPSQNSTFLYRIGSCMVRGREVTEINDPARLNAIATEIRDEYSQWIYSINKLFLRNKIVSEDLSLFFLTDLSCKRLEFFRTYDAICNLILIREKMESVVVDKITVSGVAPGFLRACRSIYPDVGTICLETKEKKKFSNLRRIVSDFRYLYIVAGVGLFNTLSGKGRDHDKSGNKRIYYSVFPQMFEDDGRELKYADLVCSGENYLVSIVTDGMHQMVPMRHYFGIRSKATGNGLNVIDDHFKITDIVHGVRWILRTLFFFFMTRKETFYFRGMDITTFIRGELRFSLSRVSRLMVVVRAFSRYFERSKIKEIVYYPVEYPFGRMISYAVRIASGNVTRIGYQMGPVSWGRIEEFLAKGEGSVNPPFIEKAPIPDRLLVECDRSKKIFEYAGYRNVSVMGKIYRYWYLDGVQTTSGNNRYLIAPGVHDGELLLSELQRYIENNLDKEFIVKPHPRGDSSYLERFSKLSNVKISIEPISELLGKVDVVFVTYSSVGVEAEYLGLDVRVVNVPGRINTTPLLQ